MRFLRNWNQLTSNHTFRRQIPIFTFPSLISAFGHHRHRDYARPGAAHEASDALEGDRGRREALRSPGQDAQLPVHLQGIPGDCPRLLCLSHQESGYPGSCISNTGCSDYRLGRLSDFIIAVDLKNEVDLVVDHAMFRKFGRFYHSKWPKILPFLCQLCYSI